MKKLLSLDEAAEALGIDRPRAGRWLKLRVLQRERDIGRQILVRKGRSAIRQHYLVNMQILRRWYPDVVDRRDEVLDAARALTTKTGQQLSTLDDRLDEIDQKLAGLKKLISGMRPVIVRAAK